MICSKCGKEIKDGVTFCPVCGGKQESIKSLEETRPEPRIIKVKICTEKQYYKDIHPKRLKHSRAWGMVVSVILILVSLAMCIGLFIGVSRVKTGLNDYCDKAEILEEFMEDPKSLSKGEEKELLRAFNMSEKEFVDFYNKYKSSNNLEFSDIDDYITTDVLVMFVLANTSLSVLAESCIIWLYVFVAVVALLCALTSVFDIIAILTSKKGMAVFAMALSAFFAALSLLATLPLFILSVIIYLIISGNRKEYDKYIKTLSEQ